MGRQWSFGTSGSLEVEKRTSRERGTKVLLKMRLGNSRMAAVDILCGVVEKSRKS